MSRPLIPALRRIALSSALITMLAAGCNGDDDAASTPPLPTRPATSVATTNEAPSTSMSSSVAETSTTSINPVPTISDPTTTTTAPVTLPTVTTLVPEVPHELLTREQLDPANPNNSRPIQAEHLPVLEAHLRLIQTTTKVSSTWPVNPDSPELLAAAMTPDVLQLARDAARGRLERGEVLNVSQGVTFRPYVVGPVTDTAVVLDCELAGHYWVKADTGELIPPNEIWPAGPGRIVEVGLRDTFVLRDGRWLLANSEIYPEACA